MIVACKNAFFADINRYIHVQTLNRFLEIKCVFREIIHSTMHSTHRSKCIAHINPRFPLLPIEIRPINHDKQRHIELFLVDLRCRSQRAHQIIFTMLPRSQFVLIHAYDALIHFQIHQIRFKFKNLLGENNVPTRCLMWISRFPGNRRTRPDQTAGNVAFSMEINFLFLMGTHLNKI